MNNPFEKLKVIRDKDDEEDEFQEVKGKEKSLPVGIEQKKRKVRPKENQQEEGFKEFRKNKKNIQSNNEEEGAKGGEHKKRQGINYGEYKERQKPRRGRQYERQSGTGRGKEIAKGGAGGKGTWGDNPKNIAEKEQEEENNDDYYFQSALNPEKEKERKERRHKKEGEEGGEGEDSKQKKEKPEKPKFELKEEEKLKRPENAQTLEEYLKAKEKPVEEEKKEVKRIQDGKPLEKREEKKEEILGTTGAGRKKGKKKKERELNQEEIDLNNQIGANLKISGEEMMGKRPRRPKKKKEEDEKFEFKEEDFPEMEH